MAITGKQSKWTTRRDEVAAKYIENLWGERRREFAREYWACLSRGARSPRRTGFDDLRIELRLDDIYHHRRGIVQALKRALALMGIGLIIIAMEVEEATASSQRLDRTPRELDPLLPAEQMQQHQHTFVRTQGTEHPNLIV